MCTNDFIQQAECDFEDKKLFTNPQILVKYILTLGNLIPYHKKILQKFKHERNYEKYLKLFFIFFFIVLYMYFRYIIS